MQEPSRQETTLFRTLLVCPMCHGNLEFSAQAIVCLACGASFPQAEDGYCDLYPRALVDQEADGWSERQQEMEAWYQDLIQATWAGFSLEQDYAPHAAWLAGLSGLVLDVGGGLGVVRDYLPRRCTYVNVEPSLSWRGSQWKKMATWFPCLERNACFVRGVAEYLPLAADRVDAVTAFWSLNHARDPGRVFREIGRVLKPGGRFLVVLEDMEPTWLDLPRYVFRGFRGRHAVKFARDKVGCFFRKKPWPVAGDHVRIVESEIASWCRPLWVVERREWIGRYLTYEFRRRESQQERSDSVLAKAVRRWKAAKKRSLTTSAAKRAPGDSPPEVTVLMAVHNGARYAREAIESILSQTYPDFELLIVNDGSTDRTRDIVLTYDDPRIRLVDNERNLGLARSLNRGLQIAAGDLVARQDVDDLSEPQRLERQVAYMQKHPAIALLGTACTEIDAKGRRLRKSRLPTDPVDLRWNLLFFCPFYHSAVMFRRWAVLERVGFYNEDLSYSLDVDFWRRIASHFPVANLDEMLVRYRVHDESMTATFGDRTREGHRLRLATVGDLLGWNGLATEETERRFLCMCSLLRGDMDGLELRAAREAAAEVMRLHEVCGRKDVLGDGDWTTHRERIHSLLRGRLRKLGGRLKKERSL